MLVIAAQRYRSQEQNRQDALERLVDLVRRATIPPKRRVKTRPTLASQEKRLESKRRWGLVKRMRQGGSEGP